MLRFNQELLISRLNAIRPPSRTVFALACADRLLPLYEVYSMKSVKGNWDYLQTKSDNLWDQVLKGLVISDDEFLDEYPELAPGDDTPRAERTILDPLAENAVIALGSAWECHVSGESQKAFWAAEQAYEAIDYMAQNIKNIDYREPDGEEALLQSGFVQGELNRQL
jgi:hypothetical protein